MIISIININTIIIIIIVIIIIINTTVTPINNNSNQKGDIGISRSNEFPAPGDPQSRHSAEVEHHEGHPKGGRVIIPPEGGIINPP